MTHEARDLELLGDEQCLNDSVLDFFLKLAVEVQEVQATCRAFAAICADGTVVTWGDEGAGGDCSAVGRELRAVRSVAATKGAFAALLADGTIVTWGDPHFGGDRTEVDQLQHVQKIYANDAAFAALRGDGTVVTWGSWPHGGSNDHVQDRLHNVQEICAAESAFAALRGDGEVVSWGTSVLGGDSSVVQDRLKNVKRIYSARTAFAALLLDGSVVTWGSRSSGGDSSDVQESLEQVQEIFSTSMAFAAICQDKSVVTWGDPNAGGDSSSVKKRLKNVETIFATKHAFTALLGNGTIVTWGDQLCGGDSHDVRKQLHDVVQIAANDSAFSALRSDGRVVAWGAPNGGGDTGEVQDQLSSGVQKLHSSAAAFAAILRNGRVVAWGNPEAGGDSTPNRGTWLRKENGEAGWQNVRRWTRSLPHGLLGQRFVILPINEQNIHWWLAVVCHARYAIEPEADGASFPLGKTPRIVCLDSAQEPLLKHRAVAFLRGYLWKEWCERHPSATPEEPDKVNELINLKAIAAEVPKQANGFDCGIFIIEYLLHLLQSKSALAGLGLARHKHWSVTFRRKRLKWIAQLLQHHAERFEETDEPKLKKSVAQALTEVPDRKEAERFQKAVDALRSGKEVDYTKIRKEVGPEPPEESPKKTPKLKRGAPKAGAKAAVRFCNSHAIGACFTGFGCGVAALLFAQRQRSLPSTSTSSSRPSDPNQTVRIAQCNCGQLQEGFLGLVGPDGHRLDPADSLEAVGLRDGDHVSAVVQSVQVVSWGFVTEGMDAGVRARLRNVQTISASAGAFAAVLGDGSLVVWGDPHQGGDRALELTDVREVVGAQKAFAAILNDGRAVAWGEPEEGGDASEVKEQLRNVRSLSATHRAFAALLEDGSVVCWGDSYNGGSCETEQELIIASASAFAAVRHDGSVVTWGDQDSGGDSSEVQPLREVVEICATNFAFCARLADGGVNVWGEPLAGAEITQVKDQLFGVQKIYSTRFGAFAALREDGHVVTWGHPDSGGDSSSVKAQLWTPGVKSVYGVKSAVFECVWWLNEGDFRRKSVARMNVKEVHSTAKAFAAITHAGGVITWGDPHYGGDSEAVQDQLKDVEELYGTNFAFAAIRRDGRILAWGAVGAGGDMSEAEKQLPYL
eukprot:g10020.t1